MGEAGKIEEIIRRLEADPRNRSYTDRGIPPVFQLSPEARILIVGQAPGKKVEETRIPFNDKSGEKLMQWLGIDRDTFYSDRIAILPMDFYYPGKGKTGDLPPRDFIAREYHEELLSLMPGLRLKILIGSYSTRYYLGKRAERNLTETVRNYRAYLPAYFPIVHPSPLNFRWQRKNPWFLEEVIPALRERVGQILQEEKA
ncbi:uracil-DNA glycosylase family protein [Oribacterium sp. oral taxon 102]|uniref:uracil-DNA glycosylase family protein n=1 Tax=Oribacterium sp. oral taxon 102 TaxID=671214 RepID=UPI0015BC333C|nr:uracil-DNA glycosylase family protein [Oribacterium sp. oral taxon 102]NWO20940.1 uracil-DNA glycosylase family protein [Oribacterium sp. oral taxon 102]